MSKKIFLAFSILVVAAMVLSACAPATPATEAPPEPEVTEEPVEPEPEPEEPAEPEPEPTEEPEPEPEPTEEEVMEETRGVLRFNTGLAYGGLENLNPVDPNRFWPPIALLWDRLAAPVEGELRPGPSLAEEWESNEAADVWTFYLRDDVFFHDGSQLTASDVVYSFDHWLNDAESVIAGSFGVVDSVDAPDDFTVVFNLNQPSVDFPLTVMDYRARVFKEGSIPDIWETGMGSGPFKLETLDVEGITVLSA
ncbi:MAG: hypothetical protein JSV69_00605, partial [Chloroflexota bacterium]